MDPASIVSKAAELGITLRAAGLVVRYHPASRMPPELLGLIREHKTAIIAFIRSADPEATGDADAQAQRPDDAPAPVELTDLDRQILAWARSRLGDEPNESPPMTWPKIPARTPRPIADLCQPREGWTASAWRDRLQQLAQAAENANAERARELRAAIRIFRTP